MPTYEYQCEACEKILEVFHGISEPPPRTCEACGAEGRLRKLISSGAGLIFKGSGFYATDYKKQTASKSEGTGKAEPAKVECTASQKAACGNACEKSAAADSKADSKTS